MVSCVAPAFPLADPHSVLGLHENGEGKKVIRLFRPGAPYLYVEIGGGLLEAEKNGEGGLFELEVPLHTQNSDYRLYLYPGYLAHDPYSFLPSIGELDLHLFSRGVHYKLYEKMGARLCTHQGVDGVRFVLFAPHARGVAVVGDFNSWDGRIHPLRSLGFSGVWELFIPGLKERERYKFEITTQQGKLLFKADPYAHCSEHRPQTASVVWDVDDYSWGDGQWMEKREINPAAAMLIYEVHLGSWKKGLSYQELALELSAYCKQMGFTHVELLPVMEHPLDESWGYQVTGFFAVTSRWGTPRDFQFFVDHLHQEGIGVILDWVPAHFPLDEHALAHFDGSYLYEHADPRQGIHPHWNTCIFNYGRAEVSNFLIASALFWADKMHVDGLRVDAVASMLYLDYGRGEGEWIPNCYGGNHNLEAIEWIKHCNAALEKAFPTVHRIAEESTAFLGVTHPLSQGGLGFTLKWNMGWMNDTLHYFSRDPFFRSHHHNALTFGLTYAFSERFLLPLSHDEVVHGKGSLLSKMPGDGWQKRANLRLLYSYQLCQPGKKLLFMGGELGVEEEWDCKGELPWHLLHTELPRFFREMNHFYLQCPALFERDFTYEGFEWVDLSDRQGSVISYLRKSPYATVLVVHNCTPMTHFGYRVYLPFSLPLEEVFNTDRIEYGGSGQGNPHAKIHEGVLMLTLAPLSTQIFKVFCG